MNSVRSEIAEFQRSLGAKTLFYGTAPLLDVLWRRVELKSSKADCGRPQNRWREIEMTGNDAGGRSKVVTLLGLRKNIRNIMTLVTPRIHVHGCEENAKGRVKNQAVVRHAVRDACARSEFELVCRIQTFWETLLSADENGRHPIFEDEIGVCVTNIRERAHIFITQTYLHCRVASQLKAVLDKRIPVPLSQLHLGN